MNCNFSVLAGLLFLTIDTSNVSAQQAYENPVLDSVTVPDPTVIRLKNGWYYLYATEDVHNVPIWKSRDMIHWHFVSTAFTDSSRPHFVPKGGIWAPEINYINGKYVLYYAMSTWGGQWTAGIGVAISDRPEGPFKNLGKLFDSKGIGVENSIDPTFIADKGKKYLIWGSFHGIYAIELTKDGLKVKDGAEKVRIAGTAYEGSYLCKRKGYYYYFGSVGTCCEGVKSTYQVVVGRSRSLLGPYLDKQGNRLLDNHYEIVIHKNEFFVGTGHNSQIVHDDAGQDWMLYHGFKAEGAKKWERFLLLSRIYWDEVDWPYVNTGSAETEAVAPYIRK